MKNVKYRAAEAIKFMLILSVIFLTTFGPPGETLKGLLSEAMEWCMICPLSSRQVKYLKISLLNCRADYLCMAAFSYATHFSLYF